MSTIKFGVYGLGRIGVVHSQNFSSQREKYQLAAVCDRDPQRTAPYQEHEGCSAYQSYEEFLANPDLELAIIATRSLDHADHALQALEAGKMVLLEKPIAVTKADRIKLEQADQDYPGKLYFLHNHRFEPAFQTIQTIIQSGVLGDLQVVKLCRHHSYRRRADWQALLECGGGQLNCWGPHLIDHALQYINAPIRDVWSDLKRIVNPGDADDHLRIILRGENAVVAEVEISNTVTLPSPYCTVYGSRGSLICADEKHIQLKYIDPAYTLPEITARADQPPLQGGYGSEESFPWIEKTVRVEPDGDMWKLVEQEIARHLYAAIREGIAFPIKNSEAFDVVRVTETVKEQNPQFDWSLEEKRPS